MTLVSVSSWGDGSKDTTLKKKWFQIKQVRFDNCGRT